MRGWIEERREKRMTNDLFKEKEETIWCMEEKFEDDRGTIDNRREKDEKKEKIR